MAAPEESGLYRVFLVVMIMAGLVVLVQGMMFARPVLVPFMMANILAIILAGPMHWLHGRGVPSWLAVTVPLSSFLLVFFLVLIFLQSSVQDFSANIPEYSATLKQMAAGLQGFLGNHGVHLDENSLNNIIKPEAVMGYTKSFFVEFTSLLGNGFLVLLAVIFILSEFTGFRAKIVRIPAMGEKKVKQLQEFTRSVQEYTLIKTLVSLLTGGLVTISLLVLGVDYAFLWGLLAFGFNFIPTVGSIIAAIPAVLLSLVQLGPLSALLVAACYLAINIVVGNFIEPRFMGKKLGLSTLVVFISLVFWGWVLGPVGMLFSVILTIKLKIILDSSEDTRWLGMLLGPNEE